MYEGFHMGEFLAGLPLGFTVAAVILFFSWRKGKKERRFDERHTVIHQFARSFSWRVTTIAILGGWMIVIIVEGPSLAFFILMGIWVVHMASYAIGTAVASKRN